MSKKISVYVSETEKEILFNHATEVNLSLSEYLRYRGLKEEIRSDRRAACVKSIACQLYHLADTVEDEANRRTLRILGGELYGIY